MNDDKIYTPTILPDAPFPRQQVVSQAASQSSANTTYAPQVIQEQPLVQPVIANETINQAINTTTQKILQQFSFAQQGAIQVGLYEPNVSGDIRISPDGIIARNKTGIATFALDGDSGDAIFKGKVLAGSLISGSMILGGSGNGDGTLQIFKASGKQSAQGDNTGFTVYDLDSFAFFDSSVPGKVATLGADGASNVAFTPSGPGIGFKFNSSVTVIGTFTLTGNQTASGNLSVGGNLSVSGNFSVSGSFNPSSITTNSVNVPHFGIRISGNGFDVNNGAAWIDNVGGDVLISSGGHLKTAIVPTTQGYKELYCMESPDVWFMDFCSSKEQVDPLFLEATEGEMHFVKLADESTYQVWRKRKGFQKRRFKDSSPGAYERNNAFWAQAHLD